MKRLALILTLLSAGAALATPSGKKWFLSQCSTTCYPGMQCTNSRCLSVYRIAASVENRGGMTIAGAQGVPYATVVARTQEAFRNWTASRVTGCTTAWDIVYGGTYSTPQGTTGINGGDGANNVVWLGGSSWRYSSGTLGLTTTTYYTSSGEITDADMELNNNVAWADDGRASAFDYESVVLHEAGHYLGLDHTTSSGSAVMYPTVAQGQSKRILQSADLSDICAVYPGAAGSQGSPCTTGSQCTSGRVCESGPAGGQKICTQDCAAAGQACPTGYTCQASNAGFACLSQVGAADLCKFCTSGGDCSTGVCLTDGAGVNWCSVSCSSPTQCGAGYDCQATTSGSVCVPTASCTNQCTTAAQCAIGYACTGGTCRPTGNTGDRCEVSTVCNACNVCILDQSNQNIAFCRQCCAGGGSNQNCQGCPNVTCGGAMTCAGLSNGVDGVCIPSSGVGLCQACNTSTPCSSGLSCVAGRCHSACLPSNPGSCSACFDLGGGSGVCACPGEVATTGQPCGQMTNGSIGICANNLLCVANPQALCRARCNVSDPLSCQQGESCELVGGQGVCLPGTAGGRCAPCTGAGTCGAGLSCHLGRCYAPCNANNPASCSTCAPLQPNGDGLCACDDQIATVNAACGPPNVIACQPGVLCLNNKCRGQCDPNMPFSCPALTECKSLFGSLHFCQDFVDPGTGGGGGTSTGGSGGSNPFGGGTGGGSGGGSVISEGCGCSAGASGLGLWALAFAMLARVRRRTR